MSTPESFEPGADAGLTAPTGPANASRVTHRFSFSGDGAEYFRIWIVNIALSVVTLGIYSAWAKVRNKQYFYGNTSLDGVAFEYTADPIAILKGRVVMAIAVAGYVATTQLMPLLSLAFLLVAVPAIPWIIVRAIAFNHRYSSHRNLRFSFHGRYGDAFVFYGLAPMASVITLGLLHPFIAFARKRFVIRQSRYGATRFEFDGRAGRFYAIYAVATVIAGICAIVIGALLNLASPPPAGQETIVDLIPIAVFGFIGVYIQTAISNYQWSNTRLGDLRFSLDLRFGTVLWLQASNLALIVMSAGLAIPFAKVRITRYRLERMRVTTSRSLDEFASAERARVHAFGEEIGEGFDVDLGL